MKKLNLLFLVIFFTSCMTTKYYQVYKAKTDDGKLTKDKIVFEDKSCSVAYNLWENGGGIGFSIYNKTENDLTIDLTKTFFVLNGVAYEYFQNRTFSKSSSSSTALSTSYNYPYYYYWNWNISKVTETNSKSFSTSYVEKPELTIPAKTLINITEYRVTKARYVNCDLPKYPSRSKIKTLQFDKSNSPFVFYNLITYKTKGEASRIENNFFVSEITNYPSDEMFTKVDTSACGRHLAVPEKVFKDVAPDKFYFYYTKEK